MKQDYPLIRGENEIAEWKTIVDHPHMVTLSGGIDTHLTEVKTLSGDLSIGDIALLNSDGTVSPIKSLPSTITDRVYTGDPYTKYLQRTMGATWNKTDNIFTSVGFNSLTGNTETRIATPALTGDTFIAGMVDTIPDGYNRPSNIAYDHINDLYLFSYGHQTSNVSHMMAGTMTTTGAPSGYNFSFGTPLQTGSTFNGYTFVWSGDMFYDKNTDHFISSAVYKTTDPAFISLSVVPSGNYDVTITDSFIYTSGDSTPAIDYDPITDQYIAIDTPGTFVVTLSGNGILTLHQEQSLSGTRVADFNNIEYNDVLVIPNTNMVVICFPNSTSSNQYVMTGIITDGAVTWDESTRIIINAGMWNYGCQLTWDEEDQKILAMGGSSNVGLELVSLTIGTNGKLAEGGKETVFSSVYGSVFRSIYSPLKGKTFLSYSNWSPPGQYVSWIKAGSSTLTDSNFYGIAQETKTDGQEIIIGRHGFMDTNQSNLNINTNYYIGEYGLLVTDNNQPFLGKAVSDTEIIIKG